MSSEQKYREIDLDVEKEPVLEREPASPVCYADEAQDVYAGYAAREEILEFLNALLEAGRAGAQIAARTAEDVKDARLKALTSEVVKNGAHWCAMLLGWIAKLNGTPSPATGAFTEKCLAIADMRERIAFINRGQGWVVKRLSEMLPKLRDDILHADLSAMLKGHEENIARTHAELNA